jgi:hypothetical protein
MKQGSDDLKDEQKFVAQIYANLLAFGEDGIDWQEIPESYANVLKSQLNQFSHTKPLINRYKQCEYRLEMRQGKVLSLNSLTC